MAAAARVPAAWTNVDANKEAELVGDAVGLLLHSTGISGIKTLSMAWSGP
jgi:hypothetical protein